MKLTFLGTSHGVPAADRYCSSTMLEIGERRYFVDAGAPLIDMLIRRGVSLDTVKAIFTTHLHGDHVNGLLSLTDLFTWKFKTTDVDVFMTEQRGIDAVRAMLSAMLDELNDERVRFRLMTADTVFCDEAIRVTPFPTGHLAYAGRPAYSYLIEAEEKKILFSGDLSVRLAQADFPKYALENEVDLLICEMAHFDAAAVEPYLARCRAKRVLFNHVYPLDKLERIEALNMKYGYPIATVNDGDEIEV